MLYLCMLCVALLMCLFLVCCVFDSVCELFGEKIRNVFVFLPKSVCVVPVIPMSV